MADLNAKVIQAVSELAAAQSANPVTETGQLFWIVNGAGEVTEVRMGKDATNFNSLPAIAFTPASHVHDASDINSGVLDPARIPALKSHEFTVVASQAARLAQTSAQVQPGDETYQQDNGITYKLVATDPSLDANWLQVSDVTPDWSIIANKPATFTPSAHTHVIADTTGLQAALDGKSNVGHTHVIGDVTGLQAALDSKAYAFNGVRGRRFFTDFESNAFADGPDLDFLVSGTGATQTPLSAPLDTQSSGVVNNSTGTTTTGRANITTDENAVTFGGGIRTYYAKFQIPTLSDGTDSFVVLAGWFNGFSTTPTNGLYFLYRHTVNGGKLTGIATNNSTTDNTSIQSPAAVVAGTWYGVKIVVNAAGTQVDYYIWSAGAWSLLGSITNAAHIPTGITKPCMAGIFILKSAGTTARNLYVDWMGWEFEPSSF